MAERPTPISISVGILIALQSDPTSPLNRELNPSVELQQNLSSFLQECVLHRHPGSWSSVQGIPLSRFFLQLQALSNDLCGLVFDYVKLAATSVDSLMDLMESLRAAITEGLVDGSSACGIFLRKVCLGFDQLSFETTSLLWSDLQEEMKLALQALEGGITNDNDNNDSTTTTSTGGENQTFWPLSASQIERALRKECFVADGMSNRGEEDISFEEMEVKLRKVLTHDPELPAAHFLRFLNCIKHGERVGALDALHQYFDYAIIQGTTGKSQDILQFAAILLASLHHSFGDSALAQLATDEAVRVAQQSMDAACVAFALGWIFSNEQQNHHLLGGAPSTGSLPLNAGDLLHRCASRAQEGGIRSLVAGANFSLTRYHISGAQRTSDGDTHASRGLADSAWRSIADAASDRPGAEAADDGAVDRPTHMTDIPSSTEAMNTLARQKLVSAGVWDYFGQVQLSGIYSFIALYCHADQMVSHDVVTAIQNVARMSLYGSPSVLLSRDFDGNVLEKHIGEVKSKSPKSEKSTDCVYADAIIKLTSLWKLFRLSMDGIFLLNVTMVLHEWAIRRGEFQQAFAFGAALESYLHPRLPNYWQVLIDISLQKSLLLTRQQKYSEAKALILDMIDVAKTNNLKTHHASLLLQLSLIHLEENPHECTSALTPRLLECLTMTTEFEMDSLHATALSVLAQVHLRMKNPNRAIALLQASLPSLLQHEHVWFQGEAFLALAKSRLQLAKGVDTIRAMESTTCKNPSLIRLLRSAHKDLQQSHKFFRKCQDCFKLREVYYLQARILNSIPGEQQQRDRAAQSFVDISKHLASADKPLAHDACAVVCLSNLENLEDMARREVPGLAT